MMTDTGVDKDFNIGLPSLNKWEQIVVNRLVADHGMHKEVVLDKLAEWFQALECRFSDNTDVSDYDPESKVVIEIKHNFGRIWKLLICSVLMAKDDGIAEILSAAVGGYTKAISEKPTLLSLFTEALIVVLVEEWAWIRPVLDTIPPRIVLISQFLRSIFQILSDHQWKDDYLEPFLGTLRVHLFNHHPPPPRSTRAASKVPKPLQAPADLQVRLVGSILQEFPNSHPKIFRFLSLFLSELVEIESSTSEKFAEIIHRSISCHFSSLSKSSTCDNMESLETSLQDIELDDRKTEGDSAAFGTAQAPNLGATTQNQQCDLDYHEIIVLLRRALIRTKHEKIGQKTESIVQELLQKFEKLLSQSASSSTTAVPSCYSTPVSVATSTVLVFGARKRKIKVRPKLLLRDSAPNVLGFGFLDTKWSSPYLSDPELLDHIEDNYMSYLVEIGRTVVPLNEEDVPSDGVCDDGPVRKQPRISEHLVVRRNLNFVVGAEMKNAAEMVSVRENHVDNNENLMKINLSPELMDQTTGLTSKVCLVDGGQKIIEVVTPKKRKFNPELSHNAETVAPVSVFNPSVISTSFTEATGISFTAPSFPKEVRFVLASNLEHEYDDYESSVGLRPVVPFDRERVPKRSLLKAKYKTQTPIRHWKKKAAAAAASTSTESSNPAN